MTEIDFALKQIPKTDSIELVGTVVWNKANKYKSFKNLSESEKTFVYIDIFESEVNNQGLFGFFYNSSGEFSHEVLQAYTTISADTTAEILDKALRRFPELPVPKDIISRRQLMGQLKQEDLKLWSSLELELVNSKEDIINLVIEFIKLNKSDFEY